MKFFDWELRPAVVEGGFAWAVLAPNEGWTEVDSAEVIDSGRVLKNERELREVFSRIFPNLPALPAHGELFNKEEPPALLRQETFGMEKFVMPLTEVLPNFSEVRLQQPNTVMGAFVQLNTKATAQSNIDRISSQSETAMIEFKKFDMELDVLTVIVGRMKELQSTSVGDATAKDYQTKIAKLSEQIGAERDSFEMQVNKTARALVAEWGEALTLLKRQFDGELEQLYSEGFTEWFKHYVIHPIYVQKTTPKFTAEFECLLRQQAPKQFAKINRLQQDYLTWSKSSHSHARALIASDILSIPTTRRTSNGAPSGRLPMSFSEFFSNWKVNLFWLTYLVIMHTFWLSAVVSNWNKLGWYDLWGYAAFQYFYASIWPVFVLWDLYRITF